MGNTAECGVCFRHCQPAEGRLGFCGGRIARDGRVEAFNYGRVTALALDPIEKKPLARFCPGSRILSVGSFGCNLRCPFCQNHEISWSEQAKRFAGTAETFSPEELTDLALATRDRGNIGLAFTYNEPLIGWEFVRDTARLAKAAGLKTVMVTNGTAELPVLEALRPWIDAMNVDLKGFTDRYYNRVLGGDRRQTMRFIEEAVKSCHVELTTLIVPGENDGEEEMRELSRWVSLLRQPDGEELPLHITRFFPRFHMQDREATELRSIRRLAEIARESLRYVYLGNC
ncbi:MAG: AmmeMemoRadiSam system radical SAM enzyme [Oscillospiraceae bacterium]|nr:AmmeMemoRadiSam system radical SAM enzyme [Oscillospiraceae bacterium]MBR7009656.1 AmmeMemoRadiSam system radical SAM enzyme [Oscillospiraceae bacterium]